MSVSPTGVGQYQVGYSRNGVEIIWSVPASDRGEFTASFNTVPLNLEAELARWD